MDENWGQRFNNAFKAMHACMHASTRAEVELELSIQITLTTPGLTELPHQMTLIQWDWLNFLTRT